VAGVSVGGAVVTALLAAKSQPAVVNSITAASKMANFFIRVFLLIPMDSQSGSKW
jgi:hypothetical protein